MKNQHLHPNVYSLLIGIICLSLLLAACTSPSAAFVPPTATAQLIQVRIGTLPYMSNAVIKIAEAEGFFAEQGLEVELVEFRSANDFIPMLIKGELDVATPSLAAGIFNGIARGGNLRIVLPLTDFAIQNCSSIAFLARQLDVQAEIYANTARWKGAEIALTSGGGPNTATYVLAQALGQGGLDLTDIQLKTIDLVVQGEALRSGQVDIVYAVEPWVTRMLADDDIGLLLPAEPFTPGLASSMIVYGARLVTNPDIGNRFAIAYLKGVRQYLQGKTPRNVELVAEYTKLDPELVEQVCWPHIPSDGYINTDSIMAYQSWLNELGVLDRVLEPEEFLGESYANAAVRMLDSKIP